MTPNFYLPETSPACSMTAINLGPIRGIYSITVLSSGSLSYLPGQQLCHRYNSSIPRRVLLMILRWRNNIFRLITWSLDVYAPFTRERMNAALDHLHKVILSPYTEDSPPVIIMFQELLEASIEQIRNTKWVQERFTVTLIPVDSTPHMERLL